jgi:hypothetical protein
MKASATATGCCPSNSFIGMFWSSTRTGMERTNFRSLLIFSTPAFCAMLQRVEEMREGNYNGRSLGKAFTADGIWEYFTTDGISKV